MPGNQNVYEQAMNMGHSAAWDQEWDKAIVYYGRAVQEMPEDPAAHNSLGLALLQARRLEDALKVYTRAHQLSQDDPIPLEKSADVLERLGRVKEAAQQYINVAELYLAQRDLEKAIGNWERAVNLASGLLHIHQRLALAYERTGQRKAAIREYLVLAFNFQRANKVDQAGKAVARAQRLEPNNPQVLNTMRALETGVLISEEVLASPEPQDGDAREKEHDLAFDRTNVRRPAEMRKVGAADERGPIGEAIEVALETLASYVFESGDLDMGGAAAIQAIEFQRQEMLEEAINAYQQAVDARMAHAGVYLNLAALQLENEAWEDAIQNFQVATSDPRLAAGALHGLSIANTELGNHRAAARNLVQTLRQTDVDLAMSPEEAEQLNAIYSQLSASIQEASEEKLRNMCERFLDLLTGADWKQRVAKTRRLLEEAISLQAESSLIDIAINVDGNVTHGLNLVDRYMRDGLYVLAMDEAHFLLENAPNYLPIHVRIAQILLDRDNIPAAMVKYNLIAETYMMRGENDRASEILKEAIKIAPMDIDLHKGLIHLMEEEGRHDEMLSQIVDMADVYYQLADFDSAREAYQRAIKLAQEHEASHDQVIPILHRLGDIEVSRLNVKLAMRTYEQIRKIDPEDTRARRALVDLNYRQNDTVAAISELDGLLRIFAKKHEANNIIKVLEELVTRYAKDMALRSRLAAVYLQTGNPDKAIEQFDSLAELQLEAGLHDDALVTIRRIISMNPPQIEDYQKLLKQLAG